MDIENITIARTSLFPINLKHNSTRENNSYRVRLCIKMWCQNEMDIGKTFIECRSDLNMSV